MSSAEHFRISTHLKDVIGRDLVVNEFVAVFELVKNSIDAGASRIAVGFDLENGTIEIVDDGKGMSRSDVTDKWLFVAYSAKRDGTEDASDYRDKIKVTRRYAGSKGIGRFSCDTLGATLDLYSRSFGQGRVEHLQVNWAAFETNSRHLFESVGVKLSGQLDFPSGISFRPANNGTILIIRQLRTGWSLDRIRQLRTYLAKLIDPFGTSKKVVVETNLLGGSNGEENVEGHVGNDIADVLRAKTTRIVVSVDEERIETRLIDRGKLVYHVREASPYENLTNAGVAIEAEAFYLNRSAKATFARRMGVNAVEFGSIFLFLNGFRIFPAGEESDDTFGLNRRKQQGSSRYFGTRDLIGKIEVQAPLGVLREASSRDAGLISDANSRELYKFVLQHVVYRLEKYVVGVNWPDKPDQDRDSPEGLSSDAARSRVIAVIRHLVSTNGVEVVSYAPDIVDTVDVRSRSFEVTIRDLASIAEREGNTDLLKRIERARADHSDLKRSEREAQERAAQAMSAARQADARISALETQAKFLSSTQDLTAEQMMLILHQAMIYSGHVSAGVERALGQVGRAADYARQAGELEEADEISDLAGAISTRLVDLHGILAQIDLDNKRLMTVARFAIHVRFNLDTDTISDDAIGFLSEYVAEVRAERGGPVRASFQTNGLKLIAPFSPVDLVVVVDNLIDNARKANAHVLTMTARRALGSRGAEIIVADDGAGINERLIDPTRLFDKGYTGTKGGTGLGLFHARQVMEKMGGSISLAPDRDTHRATFIISLPGRVERL